MKLILILLAAITLSGCTHAYKLQWQTSQSVTFETNYIGEQNE